MNPQSFVRPVVLMGLMLLGLCGTEFVLGADREEKPPATGDLPSTDSKSADKLTEKGREFLQKATETLWEASSPTTSKKDGEELRKKARRLLAEARKSLQSAHDLHKAAFTAFPAFLHPEDDEDEYIARNKAEAAYIQSQMSLAQCTYTEAQTHPRGSQQFKDQMTQSAKEFQTIHKTYRTLVAGLYARMWEGKCLEERGDVAKAFGIYNDLLAHPARGEMMQSLHNMVRQFRLGCLNSDERKDYQLVIAEAGNWLAKNQDKTVTPVELGIRYQKAVAHEKLAKQRESDAKNQSSQAVIENHRQAALKEARLVANYRGEYQAFAQAMVKRLDAQLKEEPER